MILQMLFHWIFFLFYWNVRLRTKQIIATKTITISSLSFCCSHLTRKKYSMCRCKESRRQNKNSFNETNCKVKHQINARKPDTHLLMCIWLIWCIVSVWKSWIGVSRLGNIIIITNRLSCENRKNEEKRQQQRRRRR